MKIWRGEGLEENGEEREVMGQEDYISEEARGEMREKGSNNVNGGRAEVKDEGLKKERRKQKNKAENKNCS